METSGNKRCKKGKNKQINYNVHRGSSCATKVADLHQQNKSALSVNLNCKREQTANPKKSVEPATAERKPSQAVKPWLTSTRTNLQKEHETMNLNGLYMDSIWGPISMEYDSIKKTLFVPEGQFVRSEEDELVRAAENLQPDMEPQPALVPERPQVAEAPEEMQVVVVAEKPQATVATKEPERDVTPKEPQVVVDPKEIQAAVAPEEPQYAVAPNKTDQTAKVKALNVKKCAEQQKITVHEESLPPKARVSDPAETVFQQTEETMTEVIELKGEETIKHERELVALLTEVEHLKDTLQTQKALYAESKIKILQLETAHRENTEKVLHKVRKLEEALEKEKDHQKEMETSLAHQMEENSRLATALVQAEEDLKKEKLQWKEEKSHLLRYMKEQEQALQQETSRDDLMDRIVLLEGKIAEIDKKPKKRSLWKRFLNLFKR